MIKKIGLTENPNALDIMILAMIKGAWGGNVTAARFLAEYTDGKPETVITGGDKPIRLILDKEELDV